VRKHESPKEVKEILRKRNLASRALELVETIY
jgi:hypothetical protein